MSLGKHMNQRNSIVLLIVGMAGLLGSLSEFLATHESWSSMGTPKEIAHVLPMIATFLMVLAGALGIQLPRDTSQSHKDRITDRFEIRDRVSDQKLMSINQEDKDGL